jgi:Domain of unknown function (DUF4331)
VNLAGWDPAQAKNLFAGQTVYSMVLELPDGELLGGASNNRRIGVWAVATLATDAGGWRSINRVGHPMIPPLFAQYNEDLGNRLNAGRPADDFATYGAGISKSIARVVAAYGTAEDPQAYGEMIAHRCSPTCSRTRWARRHCWASPGGMAGRSRTTRRICCLRRRIRRSGWGLARIR